jgi:PST family polysaccharide transporter
MTHPSRPGAQQVLQRGLVRHNAIALYLVHGVNLFLPVMTVPYLARVLGPHAWGVVVAAQGLAVWISVVGEYGFSLSATRAIAQESDPSRVAKIVADVSAAKVGLAMAAVPLGLVAAAAIPVFRNNPELVVWAWLAGIAQGFVPFWFFQGIEAMVVPAMAYTIARVIGAASMFVFVRGPEDAWAAMGTQAFASVAAVVVTTALMYRRVAVVRPTTRGAASALREGASMFVYRVSVSMYTAANVLILSLFAPANQVAVYGGAEKLSRAVTSLYVPLSQALFPRMSHLTRTRLREAARVASRSVVGLTLCGVGASVLTIVAAPAVVYLVLGPQYSESVLPLQILSFSIPLIGASTVLGLQWMLPMRMDRLFNAIVLTGGVFNVVMAGLLAPVYASRGMAIGVVIAEATVTALMYGALRLRARDPWSLARGGD